MLEVHMGYSLGIHGVFVGYSWSIRGVFTEYSWDIRMYRVCVGYVSGMCRECIETNKKNGGSICIFESFVLSLQKIMITFA